MIPPAPYIADKPQPGGGKLYAVVYKDGHESQEMSLPEARAALSKASTGKRRFTGRR